MSESEEEILRADKALVSLVPKRSGAGRFMRGFSWILGGAILRHFQTGSFLKSFNKGEVEAGDIKDVVDKTLKTRQLILTEKNLIITYRKGTLRKKDMILGFPLEYAKSIEKKGSIKKFLNVEFEVVSEEKPVNFYLKIWLKKPEVWLNELKRLILP